MNLEEALIYTEKFYQITKPYFKRFDITGALRRREPEIDLLEYIVIVDGYDFDVYLEIKSKKGIFAFKNSKLYTREIFINKEKITLRFYTVNSDNFGIIQFLTTRPSKFTHKAIKKWNKRTGGFYGGFTYNLNEFLRNNVGTIISTPTEESVFKILGIEYTQPYSQKGLI